MIPNQEQSPPRQQIKSDLKAVGISEDLHKYVMADKELDCVLTLNNKVQVVKDKHAGNKLKNKHLEQQFEALEARFKGIIKESGNSRSTKHEKKAAGAAGAQADK